MKVALLVLSTTSAYAGVCHPNGGGNGGGAATSQPAPAHVVYDSEQRYVPRRAHVEEPDKCYEETADINGYRNCTKFGEWATNTRLPHLFIELGMNMRHFGNGLGGSMQSVTHGAETFQYRIVMPQGAHSVDTAVVSDIRGGVGLGHGVYVGVDAELGGLAAPAQAGTEMMSTGTYGSPEITQGRDMMLVMTGIVGVRGTTKHGALGVEAAGGARSVRYAFDSAYHDCNQTTTITSTKAIVEARARAELWLGPWITAGATVGTSVISQGDWLAGVYLGVHSQAFGGGH